MSKNRQRRLIHQKPRGAVMIIIAIGLIALFGIAGLGIDTGYAYLIKSRLQSTADAAALACVIQSEQCARGEHSLEVNPHGFAVDVVYPIACPNPTLHQDCARATAVHEWRTLLLGALGTPTARGDATAIAGRRANFPSCLTTINSVSVNGTNMLTLEDCSADIGGLLQTTNKSGIQVTEGSSGAITIYNGHDTTTCGNCSPQPIGTPKPIPDLPSYPIPTVDLNGQPLVSRDGASCISGTCLPGTYTSLVRLTGPTTLASGIYVFNGGLDTNNQRLTNSSGGVSLYVSGTADIRLTGEITLTAPTPTGCSPGSGVVISHSLSGTPRILDLNGNNVRLNLTGIVNLGADRVTVGGASADFAVHGTVIAYSLSLNGNLYPNASPNPCNNLYQASRISLLQ
jgi:hypothetical protein